MSVVAATTYSKIDLPGEHQPYYRNPLLHVVGWWWGYAQTTGDGSGGSVTLPLAPLPSAPVLPYLPKTKCWYTVEGVDVAQGSASMKVSLALVNDLPAATVGNTVNTVFTATIDEGGSGYKHLPDTAAWHNWMGYYAAAGGLLKAFYLTNTDTQGYYFTAQGLLLKTKRQLKDEGLW